ncbi:MAG: hypothetical protein B5M53_06235 [Candidatus Cloacimonas sp. 4484_209]|nr:MAG: hypothetical protein B5M53_06235 [Candidatus Cloacimonas sp. 4484_209]
MRIGIVGIGSWGRRVAREYLSLQDEGFISVALCDIDESKLIAFKEKTECYNSFDKFLCNVDALHICVPNNLHFELAKKALISGKHVLIEKPMTTNSEDAYKLVELASEKGVILQVGHIFRFANVIRKAKELFQSGYFGRVFYFNMSWTHLYPPVENLDVVWDLLPHPLDILNFITGEWPYEFVGMGRAFRREKWDEVAILQAAYRDFFANFHLSWLTPIRRRTMEIVGSKRTGLIECVDQQICVYEGGDSYSLDVEPNNTIREEALNFIKSIETGKSCFNSAIIGARVVDLIEKAIKSLR